MKHIETRMTVYRVDGGTTQVYLLHNRWHREDGPALRFYRPEGTLEAEYYCRRGSYHREDGPAYIAYRPDGSVWSDSYYRNGSHYIPDTPQT